MSRGKLTLQTSLPYILVLAGIIGYIASYALMFDKLQILKNPHYIPSCNLNPIVSCGVVLSSAQATTFGISNDLIGLGVFPILTTVGVAMLAGAKFKRWYWLGLEAGAIFGVLFVHYLFFQSVYRIHDLCPFCISMWIATITTFWYVSLYNIDNKHIMLPAKGKSRQVYDFIRRHHLDLLILWFVIIAGLILKHFWYYYGHYF